ncbi:hypothetical protein [Renibacterium salmoninarum]|uniref:hypothetical protein n=1 Tax=Renibacterium salmoninarum TaxID=1646 RepID=UPI000311EE45|nr:hypothetical protein [Renibacterium salmoninarum]
MVEKLSKQKKNVGLRLIFIGVAGFIVFNLIVLCLPLMMKSSMREPTFFSIIYILSIVAWIWLLVVIAGIVKFVVDLPRKNRAAEAGIDNKDEATN